MTADQRGVHQVLGVGAVYAMAHVLLGQVVWDIAPCGVWELECNGYF